MFLIYHECIGQPCVATVIATTKGTLFFYRLALWDPRIRPSYWWFYIHRNIAC